MLEELEYNLWEHILCRLVDYGHCFSPELEMAALTSGDELLHGEAVNIDMALTTQVNFSPTLVLSRSFCANQSSASKSHLDKMTKIARKSLVKVAGGCS